MYYFSRIKSNKESYTSWIYFGPTKSLGKGLRINEMLMPLPVAYLIFDWGLQGMTQPRQLEEEAG